MFAMAFQITGVLMVCSTAFQVQIKENTKAQRHWPLWGAIHRWPVNSPHKGPVTRKMFPIDDVIMDMFSVFVWFIFTYLRGGGGVDFPFQWRHNGRDSVSNHQPYDCLFNGLFNRRWKKTSKPVNSPHKWPVTRKMFPSDDVIMQGGYRKNTFSVTSLALDNHTVAAIPKRYIERWKWNQP